jgi:hypothetical protein
MLLLESMGLPQMLSHMHHMRAQTADSLPYMVFDLITKSTPHSSGNPLLGRPRPASWLSLIDMHSPGLNLSDFGNSFSHVDAERSTSIQSMRFNSCGYVRLASPSLDQNGIGTAYQKHMFFAEHEHHLAPAMLNNACPLLGEIMAVSAQKSAMGDLALDEMAASTTGFGMHEGWDDQEAADIPTHDGCAPGGTGRFSGVLRAGDRRRDE